MDSFSLLDNVEILARVESCMAGGGRVLESTRRVQGRRARLHTQPHPKGRSAAWDKEEEGGIGADDDDSQ